MSDRATFTRQACVWIATQAIGSSISLDRYSGNGKPAIFAAFSLSICLNGLSPKSLSIGVVMFVHETLGFINVPVADGADAT